MLLCYQALPRTKGSRIAGRARAGFFLLSLSGSTCHQGEMERKRKWDMPWNWGNLIFLAFCLYHSRFPVMDALWWLHPLAMPRHKHVTIPKTKRTLFYWPCLEISQILAHLISALIRYRLTSNSDSFTFPRSRRMTDRVEADQVKSPGITQRWLLYGFTRIMLSCIPTPPLLTLPVKNTNSGLD